MYLLWFYVFIGYSNEIDNEATYNINYDQKLSNSGCVLKNDAVLYQDKSATILYEQFYSPKEYTFSHYLGDFSKLTCNSIDDLNYYFIQARLKCVPF